MEVENESALLCWVGAIVGSLLVGMCGLVPLLVIPSLGVRVQDDKTLRLLLSFGVGGLLGDVFLHILPESYGAANSLGHTGHLNLGLWILGGILTFLVLEKIFEATDDPSERHDVKNNNTKMDHGKKIVGYLNLVANCVDNFIHGLAVASSFLGSFKLGLVTTLAILIHEIPHEIGDFAILLKSGFCRWDAAKAQVLTASVGILGACVALSQDSAHSLEARTSWMLPFTAGGFLNIALVSVLPELMEEDDPWESAKQIICIFLGIITMGALSFI